RTLFHPFFLHASPHPPPPHSFPTRRSSDLHRGCLELSPVPGVLNRQKREEFGATDLIAPQHRFDCPPRIGQDAESVLRSYQVGRSEEHTSELQSRSDLVCRLLLEKKKKKKK